MKKIVLGMLKQVAVYWAPSGTDRYGKPTWATPIEIKVRWEDVQDQFQDAKGQRNFQGAVAYTDRDVAFKGVLFLGYLVDVDQADPKSNEGAWEVIKFEKIPSLDVDEYLRTAFLGKGLVPDA